MRTFVIQSFLGAFAYSGAGGNLNLTQSIYIKEKGYGMGQYAQKIAGLFKQGKQEQEIALEGTDFIMNEQAKTHFTLWWKLISIEHGLVFWFIGLVSILLLMLLSYTTTYGQGSNTQGIQFVMHEAQAITRSISPFIGSLFLFIISIMLFQTQLGVLDSTSRIMAENTAIIKIGQKKKKTIHLSKIYFFFVWMQIFFGILLFLLGISEPKTLIVLGACLNAIAMFVHIGLVSFLNQRALPKIFQPMWWRKILLMIIFFFFGGFSLIILFDFFF